jgi:hypothetical protein
MKLKKCPICGKRVYPWEDKQLTNKTDGNRTYHTECYWANKLKGNSDSTFYEGDKK